MPVTINGTTGIVNNATDLNYTGTLTGGTGVVNIGSGQLVKDASGNVGIGTSSPGAKLDLGAGVDAAKLLVWRSGNIKYGFGIQTDTLRYFVPTGDAVHSFGSLSTTDGTTYTERARIDSSGNLLVGTTARFDNSFVGFVCGLNTNNGLVIKNTDNFGGNFCIFDNSAGANAGRITHTGATTVAYTTSSDYRLKEAIAPMQGALARVAALKPCTYKWKINGSDGEGFIAHELQAVVPDCVTGEKDAVDSEGKPQYQGIDTSFLVATLTAAIQEQQAIIKSLTARITALEGAAV